VAGISYSVIEVYEVCIACPSHIIRLMPLQALAFEGSRMQAPYLAQMLSILYGSSRESPHSARLQQWPKCVKL